MPGFSLNKPMHKNFCLNPFICTRQNAYDRISPCAFGPVEIQTQPTATQAQRWMHPRNARIAKQIPCRRATK